MPTSGAVSQPAPRLPASAAMSVRKRIPSNEICPAPRRPGRARPPSVEPVADTSSIRPPFVTSCPPRSAVPAWKTSAPAASAVGDAVIGVPDVARARVVCGREHDRHGSLVRRRERRPRARRRQRPRAPPSRSPSEPRQDRLRLGVAEAAVELEHPRAVRRSASARRRGARRTACRAGRARPAPGGARSRRARRPRPPSRVPARTRPCRPCSGRCRRRRALEVLRGASGTTALRRRRARTPRPRRPRAAPRSRSRRRCRHGAAARRRAPPACGRRTRPCPAASPSTLTTQGGRATASASARRDAGGLHHLLREALRALDPRCRGARPEHRDARVAELRRRRPATSGASGPITTRSTSSAPREREQALGVVRADGVAVAEPRDPRVARRRVELGERAGSARASRRARARAPRADEQHLHAPDANGGVGAHT